MQDEKPNYTSSEAVQSILRALESTILVVDTARRVLTRPSVSAANAGELADLASAVERLRFIAVALKGASYLDSDQDHATNDEVGRHEANDSDVGGRREEQSSGDTLPRGERYNTFQLHKAARESAKAAYARGKASRRRRGRKGRR